MVKLLVYVIASALATNSLYTNQCPLETKDYSPSCTKHDLSEKLFSSDSGPCNLVPGARSSCFELEAEPFINDDKSEFGALIEGAGVNPQGELFAVNYGTNKTIYQLGKFYPRQELFYKDTNLASFLNGIRFVNHDTAMIADVANHRVIQLKLKDNTVVNSQDFCSHPQMLQPNDLAVAKTGVVFTSGMKFSNNTDDKDGDLWSCTPQGGINKLAVLGRTNGIELSPDEKFLYLSESYTRDRRGVVQKLWRYPVNTTDGTVGDRKLWLDFSTIDGSVQNDIDGIKFDTAGHLFVTRHGRGEVAIFDQDATPIGRIKVSFLRPTNLQFGGPDGNTLFIVGQCPQYQQEGIGKGCVDKISFKIPGATWSKLQPNYKL